MQVSRPFIQKDLTDSKRENARSNKLAFSEKLLLLLLLLLQTFQNAFAVRTDNVADLFVSV